MASPNSKKPRMDENFASGYIHSVSPMKTSRNGNPYFNAKLQEDDKVTDIVGHKEKIRADLSMMQNQRTPVKLSNVSRTPSLRTPGSFDNKLSRTSSLSPTNLSFSFEKMHDVHDKTEEKSVKDIEHVAEGTKIQKYSIWLSCPLTSSLNTAAGAKLLIDS